jgi:hypothetical protein
MLSNGDEYMKNALRLFAQGRVQTFDWAQEAEALGIVEPRSFVRRLACPRLYETPTDTWRQVWRKAGEWLGKQGEYEPPFSQLEVWAQREGGSSIETSTTLERWSELARDLAAGPPILTGMAAVRTSAARHHGFPGVTVVVETPSGGADGALMLVNLLGEQGIGGCLANQAGSGRWGIVKLMYSPCWYAADEARVFEVDWARWASLPDDQNESKRIWCEHATLAVSKVMLEFPPLGIDSVFLDEYAATDRLWLLRKPAIRRLCAVSHDQLAAELARLSAEPLPLPDLQRHWDKLAARKRTAAMVKDRAFVDEVQRQLNALERSRARARRTKPKPS